jgi:hypothetical protein
VPTAVLTVDGLVSRYGIAKVGFIKADVEGAELAVLAGARETLRDHRPALLLEIEDRHLDKYGATALDVVAHLRDSGYQMYRWRSGSWAGADQVTADCRNYLFRA